MSRILQFASIFLIALAGNSQAQLTGSVNDDNQIVLSTLGDPVELIGIDLLSEGGYLIPVPGGASASAAPFGFLLANTAEQVTYGSVGNAVTIDGELVLAAGYDTGAGDIANDLVAQFGDLTPDSAPISIAFSPAQPIVPEPGTGLMLLLGSAGLGLFRRRR